MSERANGKVCGRAIVVGASMVGMAVARALSEHFHEVIVIERDLLPKDGVEHRRGVPQSFHIHNLTMRGQEELEQLFPGYGDEARRLGAVPIDHGKDVARCTAEGFCPLVRTDFVALSATRALMEQAERHRFLALCKNVRVIEETRVTGLITESAGLTTRAAGVLTDHAEFREIRGELVVDCSGRRALWKDWFKVHELPLPRETVVDSGCSYSSRFYRPRHGHDHAWKAMTVDPIYPTRPQWGVIVPLENGEWVVTLGGFNGAHPPSDEQGFLELAHRMQTPLFSQWIDDAVPTTPVRTFRRLEMRWNHFESGPQTLSRFLAIGDSAWAYNPLYGQGMSIGVTCARILRDLMRESWELDTLASRYYPAAKKFAHPAWISTAVLDLAWPKTAGKRAFYMPLMYRAMVTLLRAAAYEERVFESLLYGIHLLKQSHQLVTVGVVLGILRFLVRKATGSLKPLSPTYLPRSMEELRKGHDVPALPDSRTAPLPQTGSSARLRIAGPPP